MRQYQKCSVPKVHRQQGSVLVIGMIILVVLMVGAVTMMNSSVQDERMTGNTRRGTDAFLAAEAGMVEAVTKLDGQYWFTGGYVCDGGVLKVSDDGMLVPVSTTPRAVLASAASANGDPYTYEVRFSDVCTNDSDGFLETMGLVSDGQQAGSARTVIFNVGHGNVSWPAVFVNDNGDDTTADCDFNTLGGTGNYGFFGNGGPPFATNSSACREHIEGNLGGTDKVDGPIIQSNPAPDFTSVDGLYHFYRSLVDGRKDVTTEFSTDPYINHPVYIYQAEEVVKGNKTTTTIEDKDVDLDDGKMGTDADPRIYVINGDFLNKKGNLEGNGVLVVTGKASFSGTPNWDGIIIVLGGDVVISGGGTGDTGFHGTMIVSDINYGTGDARKPEMADYGEATPWTAGSSGSEIVWDTSGGGSAGYHYDCDKVAETYDFLQGVAVESDDYKKVQLADFEKPDCAGGAGGSYGDSYVDDWAEIIHDN